MRALIIGLCGAVAAAAAASAGPSLCSLVAIADGHTETSVLAALRADGTLGGPAIPLSVEPMSGLLACSTAAGAAGTCLYSPPLADQATTGLIEVGIVSRKAAAYKLHDPAGFKGSFEVGALAASETAGDAVALMATDSSGGAPWVAITELTLVDGVPRVRYNLTGEHFQQLTSAMGSAYDAATRTSYVVGVVGGNPAVVAVPLGPALASVSAPAPATASGDAAPPAATWLPNATLPDAFSPLGFTWCGGTANAVVGVGIVAAPSVYGMYALSAKTLKWRKLIAWTKETFYLSGLGQITCSPDGTIVHAVLSNAQGVHVLPGVDTATGKEVSRITMANSTYFVGAVSYCPSSFA